MKVIYCRLSPTMNKVTNQPMIATFFHGEKGLCDTMRAMINSFKKENKNAMPFDFLAQQGFIPVSHDLYYKKVDIE